MISLSRLSNFQIALAFSLALHGMLLGIRIVDPEGFERIFKDTPLEVILVNSKSGERPDVAQAIAQANLAGGGEADSGRAKSPLPPSAQVEIGDADDMQQRQIEQLQVQQQQLLAQIRREMALLPPPNAQLDEGDPAQQAQEERRRQLVQQLAEIEKRINASNARPKRRFVSPATREEKYALYYDTLKRRIEDRGTRNFPEQNGRKLYGELVMNLFIDSRGNVVDTEIIRSSGNRSLDRQAGAIVRAAAPFGNFTAAMKQEAEQLVVTSKFRFTREEGLSTEFTTR